MLQLLSHVRLAVLIAFIAPQLAAQPLQVFDHSPDDFVGAAACGGCHPAQQRDQSKSGHATSLAPVFEHSLAGSFLPLAPLTPSPQLTYTYGEDSANLVVSVSDGDQAKDFALEWAFGAGGQAVTFVGQADADRYVEHHLSYYSATDSLSITPGHQDSPTRNLDEALGVEYQTFGPKPSIMRCFQCHSTGPLGLGDSFKLEPNELGVRCEVCHGPGRSHVEAVQRGDKGAVEPTIGNPARLSGSELLQFCGSCHRPPSSGGEVIDWSDPWNVRHQPVYLGQSSCFLNSGEALTCMSCHDPHEPLSRATPEYEARCQGCHDSSKPPASVCTQNPASSCVTCHMPAVAPQPNLRFTNHWIGVYEPGKPLRPRSAGLEGGR